MANLGQPFDPNSVEPSQDYGAIPSGEYPVIITDSDMVPTKAGTGQFLKLTHQVIEGPYKGRLLWARLNLDNPSPKAVEIAQRDLSAICQACGVTTAITDSQQLHNRPMIVRVEFTEAGKNGMDKDGNEIKAWKRLETAGQQAPAATPAAPTPQAQAPAAATPAPPWAA